MHTIIIMHVWFLIRKCAEILVYLISCQMWVGCDDVLPETALREVPQLVDVFGRNTGMVQENQGTVLHTRGGYNHHKN